MTVLATIGYEGALLDDFLATLRAARISTLIDVRELPISRRKGFAKNALSAALEGAGIAYVHLKGLGDPKEGREAARASDMEKFLRVFGEHMLSEVAQVDLARALKIAEVGGACLMCYERSPHECHRQLVASALSAKMTNLTVRHLGVKDGIAAASSKISS